MERRVVVTGIGTVNCGGNNVGDFWDSVVNGKCGIMKVDRFDVTDYRTKVAGQVKDFDISKYMSIKEARRLDMYCHYAIAATDEAMECAGLAQGLESVDKERVGVVVSSGIGGIQTIEKQYQILLNSGPGKISPFLVPMMIADLAAGNISVRYGAQGPNMGIVTACATSTHSIGESMWMIKRGDADIMISGGAEAGISPISFAGFCAMKAMSPNEDPKEAMRPFDSARDGFIMSEGAGVLVLEELEHAKARGANILAEVVGYGASGDAHHITAPAPGGAGAVRAIKMAMKHAGLEKDGIDYINAHGTSTPLNDKFETLAYKTAFEENAPKIPISSIKGTVGHNLGAAGAIEIISCIKTINEGIIPPTINYVNPDPECDLDYTPNTAREVKVNTALNLNLGFGGHNAVVIIKKFE